MPYTIEYFHSRVREEIEAWPDDILADYARIIELAMEFGPDLHMPHSRPMGKGLFELRPRGGEGIGRAIYCFLFGRRIVILHAFLKKSRQTPKEDLEIAGKRMREVKSD